MKNLYMVVALSLFLFIACNAENIPIKNETSNSSDSGVREFFYKPMQCDKTPWETWYASIEKPEGAHLGGVELVRLYYWNVHQVELLESQELNTEMEMCEACSVCPRDYAFRVLVYKEMAGYFENDGWTTTIDIDYELEEVPYLSRNRSTEVVQVNH